MKFFFTDLEDEMKKTVEEVILKITDNKALRKLMCRYYLMYKYIYYYNYFLLLSFSFPTYLYSTLFISHIYIIYIIICSMGGCPAEISFAAYAMLADHYLKGSSYPTVYKYKYYYY